MAFANHEYKIILLGEPGVGKTTFFLRLKEDKFVDVTRQSLTVECLDQTVALGDTEIKANLYDTAGGERFRTLTSNFYHNSDAAILMYSVEDRYSFDRLQDEIENASRFIEPDSYTWALVGNKSDLLCEVDENSIQARCESLGTDLSFFTSAKTGSNVRLAFSEVVKRVHELRGTRTRTASSAGKNTFRVQVVSTQSKSHCSCPRR